jgi:phosphoribosylamine---glycine ligase
VNVKSLKVLVLGQGGREHALVHALARSASVAEVHAAPGSSGISLEAQCHDLSLDDAKSISNFCVAQKIDFVFIGPEDPLVAGLSDELRENGVLAVGPSKEAAQLEGSKIFSKEFMRDAGVPTSQFQIVSSTAQALIAAKNFTPPFVLKADGLAAGKGVFICQDIGELERACKDLFDDKILGLAGHQALLEEYLPGWELSYLVLTNGEQWQTLPLAQDHKRLLDGDKGPNTGGMGTVAPLSISAELRSQIETKIVAPSVNLLKERNMLYRGVLFIGVMVTDLGPQVLEYNCRFGDPETQVILPLIDGDWGLIFKSLAGGKLLELKPNNLFASCVVMAAPGYPISPEKGLSFEGDLHSASMDRYFLHAGSKKTATGQWQTNGGRVLNAIGLGASLKESLTNAYEQAQQASWPNLQMRSDIGKKQKTDT